MTFLEKLQRAIRLASAIRGYGHGGVTFAPTMREERVVFEAKIDLQFTEVAIACGEDHEQALDGLLVKLDQTVSDRLLELEQARGKQAPESPKPPPLEPGLKHAWSVLDRRRQIALEATKGLRRRGHKADADAKAATADALKVAMDAIARESVAASEGGSR